MGSLSLGHLLVLLVIVLLVFGAGRLSDVGKGLGEGIKNFKKGLADDDAPRPRDDAKPAQIETREAKQLEPVVEVAVVRKKRVIQVEVNEDDDDAEVARKIAASKKAGS